MGIEGLHTNVSEDLTGEIDKSEVLANTPLGRKAYNMYQSLTKTHKTKQNSAIKELLAAFFIARRGAVVSPQILYDCYL